MCRRLVVFGTGAGARPAFRPGRQIPDRTVHRRAPRPRYAFPPGAGGKNHRPDALHPRSGASRPGGLHGRRGDGQARCRSVAPRVGARRGTQPAVLRGAGEPRRRAGSDAGGDRPHRHLVCRHAQYARRRGRTGRRGAGDRRDDATCGIALLPRFARLFNNPVYRRLRLVHAGAGGLVPRPQRHLYRGQRREAAAGAGVFPYRPARIRRCMAEPRQYACRPCRRG